MSAIYVRKEHFAILARHFLIRPNVTYITYDQHDEDNAMYMTLEQYKLLINKETLTDGDHMKLQLCSQFIAEKMKGVGRVRDRNSEALHGIFEDFITAVSNRRAQD